METGKMKLALSAGALALSMALAGCGGSSSSGTAQGPGDSDETETVIPAGPDNCDSGTKWNAETEKCEVDTSAADADTMKAKLNKLATAMALPVPKPIS